MALCTQTHPEGCPGWDAESWGSQGPCRARNTPGPNSDGAGGEGMESGERAQRFPPPGILRSRHSPEWDGFRGCRT